jgi:GH25 family lysozyme M1 (1,4-beta-N-acetylmuramidase)
LILGIDVASIDLASIDVDGGSINWQAVENANISFAFIKATGLDHLAKYGKRRSL